MVICATGAVSYEFCLRWENKEKILLREKEKVPLRHGAGTPPLYGQEEGQEQEEEVPVSADIRDAGKRFRLRPLKAIEVRVRK